MNPYRKGRPGRIALAAISVFFAAVVARTLSWPGAGQFIAWYAALFLIVLILYFALLWRPGLPDPVLHLYFVLQSALILALLAVNPKIDFVTALYPILAYQAALVLSGRARWFWVGAIVLQTPLGLMIFLDPLQGLALGLSPMAFAIISSALVVVNEELERAGEQSRALLRDLESRHSELQSHAERAEELAALEERNRLARALHDSVSQTMFSIILNARSAQILLERDPGRLRAQLDRLQELTQSALVEMRGFIARLRPGSA